ncbi:MAG: hypothetical protein A2V67_20455 [Deltaproteobacteria bacterium RBG_13_61_14]|nr:MAG: hypothetical protein A2V67_20455 [Deltaproteobacteria bacterium RBG_13_61_14]
MAWTTILASQTDADSPLNQVLFDAIRENLDYLKDLVVSPDNYVYYHLGGSAGEVAGVEGTEIALGGCFNLPAPPSGKKWRLHLVMQAKKTSGTPKLRFRLYDKTDTLLLYVDSAYLTSTYLDYSLTIDITTAIWGRLLTWFVGASSYSYARNGACRAYLVNVIG